MIFGRRSRKAQNPVPPPKGGQPGPLPRALARSSFTLPTVSRKTATWVADQLTDPPEDNADRLARFLARPTVLDDKAHTEEAE